MVGAGGLVSLLTAALAVVWLVVVQRVRVSYRLRRTPHLMVGRALDPAVEDATSAPDPVVAA